MKVYPVQNRFTAGEISPKLHSRSDIEGYSAGCKTLENFIALRHGSIERRDGTRIVSTHAGYRAKLFEFPISDTLAFCATFSSNGFLYLDDRDGNLHGDNLVANNKFTSDLSSWTDGSTGLANVDWIDGRALFQTGGTGATDLAKLSQSFTIDDAVLSNDHLLRIEGEWVRGAATLDVKLGTTAGGTDLLNQTIAVKDEPIDISFLINPGAAIGERYTAEGDRRVDSSGNVLIISGAVVYLTIEVDGNGESEEGIWWLDLVSFRERNAGLSAETALAHPYDAHDLAQMQVEMVPGEEQMYVVTGRKPPRVLAYNDGSWTFNEIDFSGRPAAWTGYIDYDTDAGSVEPNIGDVVEVLTGYGSGGTPGDVYRFLGTEKALGTEDYSTGSWTNLGKADLLEGGYDYTTDDGSRRLNPGDKIFLVAGYAGGGTAENVYQWAGTLNLSTTDYTGDDWAGLGAKTTYEATANFPGTVTFFEGRSWWAGYPETQDTLNASKSADYTDLRLGDGNDADGIQVTIDDHALVQWIRGEQDLLLGTKNGEYIFVAEAGPITPSDISANKQSANGSANMKAQAIGNSVAYTSLDGSKIRDMEYKFVVNGWQSMDISFTAEHLFDDSGYGHVTEIHFAKDPESIIWFITERGYLIGCTFDPANDVIGWHRHPTNGKVLSGTVIRNKGKAELWLAMDRYTGASKTIMLERVSKTATMDAQAGYYQAVASTAIADFTHLASKTVNVKIDGVQADDKALDANGDATSSASGNLIEVGMEFTAKMVTLPTDVPVPGGTGYIHTSRWNKLYARLYNSFIPTINGQLPITQVTEGNEHDGLVDVVSLGWDLDSNNTIEMAAPYKCRISGIFGELTEEIR